MLFTAARLEASCASSWADSGVAAPWAPGRSSGARLLMAQCALAGPSVQPQEPSLLLPSGLQVSGPQPHGAVSVSGLFCPCVGWATVVSIPPRHMRRGKTNSPGHLHRLAWPYVGLSVTQAAASAGSLCRAQPSPCPVHSRPQCVPSCCMAWAYPVTSRCWVFRDRSRLGAVALRVGFLVSGDGSCFGVTWW